MARRPLAYPHPLPRIAWKHGFYEGHRFVYVDTEQPGAWPNGTRVQKVAMDRKGSDTIPLGGQGTVIGSLDAIQVDPDGGEEYGYFVEYDEMPGVYIMTRSYKLGLVPA